MYLAQQGAIARPKFVGFTCGLSGLGCAGDRECGPCAKRGMGLLEDEEFTGAVGNWAHGAVDLVTWGFAALVVGTYAYNAFKPRVERARARRSKLRAAQQRVAEAKSERGFW